MEQKKSEITITRRHRPAGFVMPEDHFHSFYELYYVSSGKCCFFLNDTLYSLSTGDIMLVAPGDLHHTLYTQAEGCDRFTVCFHKAHLIPALTDSLSSFPETFTESGPISIAPAFTGTITALLEHMLTENRLQDSSSVVILTACLHQLFGMIIRYRIENAAELSLTGTKDTEVLQAAKYIYQNFSSPLSLNEVAAVAGLSPTYFSKKFKQITGIGFKEYVNFVRMKNATMELLSTDHSITEIALNNGFTDGNYFKDSFKKIHGCSPREFRKRE